ncbi:AsmA family protein [Rhodoferax sp.]|uniref:AsmA family protein n=1 Tax=Rhodoferax sp. TaxID=50421 RepID=UPI001EBA9DC7|nr:AsmA family protein [Rhodoferax sp.]MBT9505514.1 AsmA family protein [Rhodoferax sp.]
MKALRIVGIVVGAVVVLLLLGAVALYALFDGEKVKSELSRVMLEEKQRTLVIEGQPKLSLWPDIGIALDRVTLSERASKTEFVALQSARVSVALMPLLSRQVKVRGLELNGLKATVVKTKSGSFNFSDLMGEEQKPAKTPEAPATKPAEPLQIDIASIKIADAQVTWRDEKSGSTTVLSNIGLNTGRVQADGARKTVAVNALALSARGKSAADVFEVKLDAPRLDISPEKSGGDKVSLAVTLAGGDRRIQLDLSLSGVQGNADALQINSLALKLDAKSGDTTVKGQLGSPVAVNVTAQTLALSKLSGNFDVASPKMPMKQLKLPVSGSLKVDAARQSAVLDLATQFDESHIAVKLNVSKFAPLGLAFELDVDKLNVDKYFPPQSGEAAAAGGGKGDKTAKEAPLDFSALKGPSVRGVVRVGALQVSGIKLDKLNTTVNLAGGRLELAPLSMNLYQGSASGRVAVNAVGNSVSIQQNLVGVSINPLMKDLVNKDLLEGRGNVQVDLSSRGDTVSAMKKALAGTASLSLKDGAIKGINLAQSLRDIKGKLGGQSDSTQQAKAGEKTDFSELTASLKVANGVAHNDDLAMKSPFLRLAGAGDIDIGAGQMNYLAKASVVASGEGQGGKGLDQLKGLTVPVRVSGPFESLSYKLEFSSMVSDLAKARVEEKKQEIKTQAEDKAKGFLKGLLGR